MKNEINPGYQWEPQRFDEEFADAVLTNILEFIKFKKLNQNSVLKKAGFDINCDHPATMCSLQKIAEISDPQFKHKEWQYKCGQCGDIVFPNSFGSLPSYK
jgi:Zn finger protein HypA/HybF involved in hydrogenase expression